MRHCSKCHLPGHTAASHRRGKRRRVRRNVDGFVEAGTFHPIRASKGYSELLSTYKRLNDRQKAAYRASRKRKGVNVK